jgi:hypothetical protein
MCKNYLLNIKFQSALKILERGQTCIIRESKKITGGWRKLHNLQLRFLYPSLDVTILITSSGTRRAAHVAHMRERAEMLIRFWWESQRPRSMWKNNIKMDLREIGWDGMDWVRLAKDRD